MAVVASGSAVLEDRDCELFGGALQEPVAHLIDDHVDARGCGTVGDGARCGAVGGRGSQSGGRDNLQAPRVDVGFGVGVKGSVRQARLIRELA